MDNENLDGLQGSSSHSRFAFQDPTDYHALSTMHSHHHHNHRHLHSSSTSSRYSGSAAAAVRAISGKPALAHTIHDVGKSSVATSDTRSKITTDTVSSTSSGSGNMGGLLEIADDERRERAEWQEMLTAALTGEVVDSEKKRLNTQPDDLMMNMSDTEFAASLSELLQNQDYRTLFKHIHTELWVGCRAAIRGRTTVQEKQTLESLRVKHVDNVLRSVMEFNTERCVGSIEGFGATEQGEAEFNKECLVQLQKLLRKVDYIEGLYPTLKALGDAKPLYVSAEFQARLSAMISWTNLVLRLQLL
ncbi:Suppressor of Sensor Kinase (SLN1), partial [Linderina macrospora]